MKKKIIRRIIIIVFAVCFLGLIFSQIVFPVRFSPLKVECVKWDAVYPSIEYKAETTNRGELEDGTYVYSFNGELPSDNPEDYMSIYCYFMASSNCLIDKFNINAILKDAAIYKEKILFVTQADAVYGYRIGRLEQTECYVILDVYVGDMNEMQIQELVRGIEIDIRVYGDYIGQREGKVMYNKCENITLENTLSSDD
jgi:hypothetical protein